MKYVMNFFAKQVDMRSRNAMIEFLSKHERYDTGNSLNRRSSYAHNVKLRNLRLTPAQEQVAYDLIGSDQGVWDELDVHVSDFTRRYSGAYTIGTNGRSGGYLVLYNSHYEDTGYKSCCRTCGQLNYARVAELPSDPVERVIAQEILRIGCTWVDMSYLRQLAIQELPGTAEEKLAIIRRLIPRLKDSTEGNRCGVCRAEGERGRVNLMNPHRRLSVSISSIDAERDYEDWTMGQLRNRVELVRDFDRTCDAIRKDFIDMCSSCEVVEETIMVPKTVKRITCAKHAD